MIHNVTWSLVTITRDWILELADPRVLGIGDYEVSHLALRAVKRLPIFNLSIVDGFDLYTIA